MKIITYDAVDSTQRKALDLLKATPLPFAVIATRQHNGYGQRGRTWISPPGNLYMTVVLPPAPSAQQLALVAGVSVAKVLHPYAPDVRLKWPNDVMLQDSKLGGILIEADDTAIRIGIGLNIAAAPKDLPYPATHLNLDLNHLAPALADQLYNDYMAWRTEGFSATQRAWSAIAWRLGEEVQVRTPQGLMHGILLGLSDDGRLNIRSSQDDQIISLASAEILF